MLVCSVSMRARRTGSAAITASLTEAAIASDAPGTGNVVFATLVDDPASVNDTVDAYLGEIMIEAANATDSFDSGMTYATTMVEAASAVDSSDGDKTTAPAPDPYWTSVKLLMGFNGANASTGAPGMTDESSSARGTASVFSGAKISTAQSKFGGSSLLLSSGGADYISFPDSNDWDFGTGQFTVECFVRFTVATGNFALLAQVSTGWSFFRLNGNLIFRCGGGDTTIYSWSPVIDQWYAIAIDRDASNVARVYVDGVMRSKTTGYTFNIIGGAFPLSLGALLPAFGGYELKGYLDEVRITKGVARYASDSGYTVATSAFPRS